MKNRIGLQLNFVKSPYEAILRAQALNLPFFQCFLSNSKTGKSVELSEEEIKRFATGRRAFSAFYVHSAHLVNLAALGNFSRTLLKKEIELAIALTATHLVFHLGTAKGVQNRLQVIPRLVQIINTIADLFPG